jgi:APA family basic amino acid/polyamine antiporter
VPGVSIHDQLLEADRIDEGLVVLVVVVISGAIQAQPVVEILRLEADFVRGQPLRPESERGDQEAKNPRRDVPLGIVSSLAICSVLYVATALVLTGLVPYTELDVAAPVALAIDRHAELRWLGLPVKLGAIVAMISVMLVMTVGQARIFMAMAADGLLPSWFAKVHPRFRTPARSTVITWVAATLIGGLLPVRILGELVSIGTLFAFATVCIGVLILRRLRPELPRRFRVPAPYFTCVGGALVCFGLMAALPADTWVRLIVWTVIGLAIYAFYGYRNSRLRGALPLAPMA